MALRKMFGTLMISLLMSAVTSSNFRDETENGENTFKGLRGLSSASASSTRPIIFTFYDGEASDETEEQVILSIWKDEWQNAGWVTRILTLEDARQHPHFQTFNSMLDKSEKMKKPDYLRIMRWLAMSNQPQGGFFTNYDTFPLAWNHQEQMPNGGRLTLFETSDGDNEEIPSLISASQYEWFRFAWSLVEHLHQNNVEWNFNQIIKTLHSQSEVVHNGVLSSLKVLDGKGYSEETCDLASRAYGIRFSKEDVEKGILPTGANGISSTAEEWLAGWRKNCEVHSASPPLTISRANQNDTKMENVVQSSTSFKPNNSDSTMTNSLRVESKDDSTAGENMQTGVEEKVVMKHAKAERTDRPVIFTFYEDINSFKETGMRLDDDDELIQTWALAWREMGWEPRILDFSIARQHPEFELFDKHIKQLPFNSYERIGFYKYLAAGMAGGGWVSDFDTFPLLRSRWGGKGNPEFLPNGGNLTIYELTSEGALPVPSLVSGTADEWFRLAKNQLANAREHNAESTWNDMKAMQDMYAKSKGNSFKVEDAVVPGDSLLQKMEVDTADCETLKNKLALHISHFSLNKTGRWKTAAEGAKHRANLSRKWTRNYLNACGDFYKIS